MKVASSRTKPQPLKADEQKAEVPHLFAAPGMLDGGAMTVNREPDDSDEQYKSRCDLVDMLLKRAKEA
jgi:hypothetical protein